MALLEVKDLHTSFFTDAGEVKAVNGVSFNLERGKVLGMASQDQVNPLPHIQLWEFSQAAAKSFQAQ